MRDKPLTTEDHSFWGPWFRERHGYESEFMRVRSNQVAVERAFLKHSRPHRPKPVDLEVEDWVWNSLEQEIIHTYGHSSVKPLAQLFDLEAKTSSVVLSTSPGIRFSAMGFPDKRSVVESKVGQEECAECWQNLRTGSCRTIQTLSGKGEILAKAKAQANRLRVINASETSYTICAQRLFQDQNDRLRHKPLENGYAIGLDPMHGGSDKILLHLSQSGAEYGYEFDVGARDSTICPRILMRISALRRNWLNSEDRLRHGARVVNYYRSLCNCAVALQDGTLWFLGSSNQGGNPSGQANTTPDNSFASKGEVRYACCLMVLRKKPAMREYPQLLLGTAATIINLLIYGDDVTLSVVAKPSCDFDVEFFAFTIYRDYGVIYESPDWKKRHIIELGFLGMHFVWSNELGCHVFYLQNTKMAASFTQGGSTRGRDPNVYEQECTIDLIRAKGIYMVTWNDPQLRQTIREGVEAFIQKNHRLSSTEWLEAVRAWNGCTDSVMAALYRNRGAKYNGPRRTQMPKLGEPKAAPRIVEIESRQRDQCRMVPGDNQPVLDSMWESVQNMSDTKKVSRKGAVASSERKSHKGKPKRHRYRQVPSVKKVSFKGTERTAERPHAVASARRQTAPEQRRSTGSYQMYASQAAMYDLQRKRRRRSRKGFTAPAYHASFEQKQQQSARATNARSLGGPHQIMRLADRVPQHLKEAAVRKGKKFVEKHAEKAMESATSWLTSKLYGFMGWEDESTPHVALQGDGKAGPASSETGPKLGTNPSTGKAGWYLNADNAKAIKDGAAFMEVHRGRAGKGRFKMRGRHRQTGAKRHRALGKSQYVVMEGRDFVGHFSNELAVNTEPGTVMYTFTCHPLDMPFEGGSRMKAFAKNYDFYRFLALEFFYRPNSSTANDGSYANYWELDPNDIPLTGNPGIANAYTHPNPKMPTYYERSTWTMPHAAERGGTTGPDELYYIHTPPDAADDPAFEALRVQAVNQTVQLDPYTGTNSPGMIFCRYKILLVTSELDALDSDKSAQYVMPSTGTNAWSGAKPIGGNNTSAAMGSWNGSQAEQIYYETSEFPKGIGNNSLVLQGSPASLSCNVQFSWHCAAAPASGFVAAGSAGSTFDIPTNILHRLSDNSTFAATSTIVAPKYSDSSVGTNSVHVSSVVRSVQITNGPDNDYALSNPWYVEVGTVALAASSTVSLALIDVTFSSDEFPLALDDTFAVEAKLVPYMKDCGFARRGHGQLGGMLHAVIETKDGYALPKSWENSYRVFAKQWLELLSPNRTKNPLRLQLWKPDDKKRSPSSNGWSDLQPTGDEKSLLLTHFEKKSELRTPWAIQHELEFEQMERNHLRANGDGDHAAGGDTDDDDDIELESVHSERSELESKRRPSERKPTEIKYGPSSDPLLDFKFDNGLTYRFVDALVHYYSNGRFSRHSKGRDGEHEHRKIIFALAGSLSKGTSAEKIRQAIRKETELRNRMACSIINGTRRDLKHTDPTEPKRTTVSTTGVTDNLAIGSTVYSGLPVDRTMTTKA